MFKTWSTIAGIVAVPSQYIVDRAQPTFMLTMVNLGHFCVTSVTYIKKANSTLSNHNCLVNCIQET